jgi:hypothetical protein
MEAKTEEVKELQVLTEDQIKALPETVKENVTFLTKKIPTTELAVLNPMVVELLRLREVGENIVLMPKNSNGDYNKINIQEFTNLKVDTGKFNANIKRAAKELKKEPAKITKGIIAIEKTFLAEAKTVLENVSETFKPYLEYKEEKAAEAQRKKDQALLDKIKEETDAREQTDLKLQKTNIYNKIKYDAINGSMIEQVSEAVINGNEGKLSFLLNIVSNATYDKIKGPIIDSVLDDNVIAELKEYFITAKAKCIQMLNQRLESINLEKVNLILEAKQTEAAKSVEIEIEEISNIPLAPNPLDNIESCITHIESKKFMDGNGIPLTMNQGWVNLKNLIYNK